MLAELHSLRLGTAEVELCSIAEAEVLLAYPGTLADWLAQGELAALGKLATPKRKRDWLAARLAAKHLVGRRLQALGSPRPPANIRIGSHATREPFVELADGSPDSALPISLAHAGDYGACALGTPGRRLGLDLERIEARDPSWARLMADESETTPELAASAEGLTRLWTAKEAVSKLLGVGLSVDLHGIRPRADGAVTLAGKAAERWRELGSPSLRVSHARFEDCCLTVATED